MGVLGCEGFDGDMSELICSTKSMKRKPKRRHIAIANVGGST